MRIFIDAISKLPTVSLGTQAFIIGTMEVIRSFIKDPTFVFLSSCPEIEESYLSKEKFSYEIIARSKTDLGFIKDLRTLMRDVDVVASVSGDGYIINQPHKLFFKTIFFKRPALLFPSSMGPFEGRVRRLLSKKALEKYDVLMVRDTVTYKYFNELKLKNVKLLPDMAFAMDPVGESVIKEIFCKEKIPDERQYIGLNVSQLLDRLFYQSGINYVEMMKRLIVHLHDKYKSHVLLIPHQMYHNFSQKENLLAGDDRVAIYKIMKELSPDGRYTPILNYYGPREMKGVMSKCSIMIGGRMHSIIGALSVHVPSIIMQYSHKAGGLMDMLNMKDKVWDVKSDFSELEMLIDKVWEERQNIRSGLEIKMKEVKSEVNKTGKIFCDTLKQYGLYGH